MWASYVGFYGNFYRRKGLDVSWVIDLLKEQAPNNPYAHKCLSEVYSRLGQKDQAQKSALDGMNSTTNEELQIQLAQMFMRTRDYNDENKAFKVEYDELLEKSLISPFKKIILKTQALNYDEREGKLPSLCMAAVQLATNMDQRFEALAPLASLYSRDSSSKKIKDVIDELLAGEKPSEKISKRIFYWLKNVGDTNGAVEMISSTLSSETNEDKIISVTLSIATIGKDINEDVINKLVERIPSNGNLYAQLADIFKKREWYDNEIKYRKKALEFLTRDYEKNAQAAELIKRFIKFDELDKAEKLLVDYANVLSNNASYTLSLSTIYCAKGQTNDAFELLITNCGKMSHELDRERIIKKLLTFNWPEKNQHARAAALAENQVTKMSLDIRHERKEVIYRFLIKSYIYLNEPDKALEVCRKLFSQSGKVNQFPAVCNLINNPEKIKSFINEMLSSGSSQTYFYASAAAACEKAMLPELALKLYVKAWEKSSERWNRTRHAASAIRLANELKDYALRDEILDNILEKYKSGELPYWSLWQISNIMRKLDLNDKYVEILKLAVENSKGRKRQNAISSLVQNYRRNNDKQGIQDLINNYFTGKELDIEGNTMLIELYNAVGENTKIKPILNTIEQQLTNRTSISRYGNYLLYALSSCGEKEKAVKLAEKWFNDPEASFDNKVNLLYVMSWQNDSKKALELAENLYKTMPENNSKEDIVRVLMDMYNNNGDFEKYKELAEEIVNNPNASTWQIENIADQYKNKNLNAEALSVYDRMLDKLDENDPKKFDILNRQAELYIKMGDPKSAIECAVQSAAARPEDPGINSLLATAYRADGQNEKALEEYCKGIKRGGNTWWQKKCCEQIAELVLTTDVDFDATLLANSLLDENRTVQTLLTAANLYSVSENINSAENLVKEALGQTTIDSQKATVYNQWLDMVRRTGDEKMLDKTLRDYFDVANNDAKTGLARQISDLAMKSGDYEKAIADSKALLKKIKSSENTKWETSQIKRNIARAYMETGDTENAWKSISEMTEASKNDIYNRTDWNTYMNYARQLGKADEATDVLENAFKNSIPRQKNSMLIQLLNAYKDAGREEDIKNLVAESDKLLKNSQDYNKQRFADFYKEAGQTEKAIDLLKDLSSNGRRWTKHSAVTKLYNIYKDENQLDKALEWAEDQPESTEVNGMIAEIHREQGDYDEAVKLYQKLVETPGMEEWNKRTYINQLIKSAAKVDDDTKEKIVKKIIKNVKKETAGSVKNELRQSARIYQEAEMYDEAVSKIKKAKTLTRNKNEIKRLDNQQADCLAKAGEYDDAVKVYKKLLQDDSMKWEDRLNYQNKIAKTYNDAHRSDEAKDTAEDIVKTCREFLREHEYGGRAMNARFALAEAYKNSGDKEAARETLEKIQKKYKHTSYAKQAEKKLKDM
jgi:tetratricopeptide (TPR) repeat protein